MKLLEYFRQMNRKI